MNTVFTTNQKNIPLTVGSLETFDGTAVLNGSAWDLTGGSATLKLIDQVGNETDLVATISTSEFQVNWPVALPPSGNAWKRKWLLRDASGRIQASRSLTFQVEA